MATPTPRIVDLKLPLPWLIAAAASSAIFMATLGWQASSQSAKLDQLITANFKLEKRLDDRDVRLDVVRETVFTLQRAVDINILRIGALEGRK